MNREREEAEEPLFANPRNAAAGTMRNLDPALVARRGLGAFTYQLVGRRVSGRMRQMLTAMRGWGLPVEPHWRRCAGIDEVVAFCAEWSEKRRIARVRNRRRRRQGGRSGAAGAARGDREVSTVGDCLQVSRAAGDDRPRGHRGERGPHRRGDALCRAQAGTAGRLDDLHGDPPQRGGHRAEGSAAGRPRAGREGRRCHSEGREGHPAASGGHAQAGAVADAEALPRVRESTASR